MTTLHQRLFGMLALLLVMTSLAQEPPNFARVQALEKTAFPVATLDADGGLLFSTRFYGPETNAQSLGTNAIPLPSKPGMSRVVLAKLDRQGNARWVRELSITNSYGIRPVSAVRDSQSNVLWLVTLELYSGTNVQVHLDGTNIVSIAGSVGSFPPLLVKLGAGGELLCSKLLPVPSIELWFSPPSPLAALPGGGFVVGGIHEGGTNQPTNTVLRRFDADGNELWHLNASGTGLSVRAVRTDSQGNVFFAGSCGTNSFLGSSNLQATLPDIYKPWGDIQQQTFVARVDLNGDLQWVRSSSGTNWQVDGVALSLDASTNVFLTGAVDGINAFGFPTRSDGGIYRLSKKPFLIKFSSAGVPLWFRTTLAIQHPVTGQFGGAGEGRSVACDDSGSVYLGGQIVNGGHLFDAVPLYVDGQTDAFVTKYDADGAVQWARKAGNPSDSGFSLEAVNSLAATDDGVMAVGEFWATNGIFGSIQVRAGQLVLNPPHGSYFDRCTFLALIPYPAPPLATELTGEGLKVSWPMFPPEFALETATALGTPTLWSSNSVAVSTSNGTHSVTFPVDGPARYFRLRKPIP